MNSLTSKLDSDVRPLLEVYSFDVLALQETKLCSSIKQSEVEVENYSLFRKDRIKNGRNGGGVGLYVRESLQPRRLSIRAASNLEMIAVEVWFGRKRIIVVSVYNPPSANTEDFMSDFLDSIAEIRCKSSDFYILGDTNLDSQSPSYGRLLQSLRTFQTAQLIQVPTHNGNCIDHIFACKNGVQCSSSGTGPPVEKIHALTWVQLSGFKAAKPKKSKSLFWKWDDADWDRAKFLLLISDDGTHRDLVDEIAEMSPEEACSHITNDLWRIQSLCVPHKSFWMRRDACPWMNKSLLRLIQRRNRAYKAYKQSGMPGALSVWKNLLKACKAECKAAKRNHLESAFEAVTCPRQFWRTINKFSGEASRRLPLDLKKLDDTYVSNDSDKASAFADQFMKNYNFSEDDGDHIYLWHQRRIMDEWRCEEADILYHIEGLDNNAALGLDGISPRIIKQCKAELAPVLAALLNKCLESGVFPSTWKKARMVPVPKIPGTCNISEFRPVSVLPVLSKIAEKWMKCNLLHYLHAHLNPNQFAFNIGRSTEDAINLLQYYITSGFNCCPGVTKVAMISFDVSKAFDQVHKNLLLLSLRRDYHIPDGLAALVDSYLSDRTFTVEINGSRSDPFNVVSGVPQGSILGPHLFNAFISPILSLQLSRNSRLIGFADDLILVKPIAADECEADLQQDIFAIQAAYRDLHLSLNPSKTELVLCTMAPQSVELNLELSLNGEEIKAKSCLRYLGVQMDQRISFGEHAQNQANKSRKAIWALWRCLGKWVSRDFFQKIYTAKILPILTYGLPVTAPACKQHWLVLEKVNRVA
ncbi:MAG: hypothetical protein GY696_05560, partial [Gammaproteobacteria bacterium]|nr:hypothetical protein [Gammaproteobacteria bacterium]